MAKKKARNPKQIAWLKAYLDEGSHTFLNATASAIAAGYRATSRHSFGQIGYRNRNLLATEIESWLDEHGFSDNRLKLKLLNLIEAKQTVFHKLKGVINEKELPQGHRLVVASEAGEDPGDSLIGIDVVALETQRRALDMAFKIKGTYAPDRHEHTGKDGKPIEVDVRGEMNLQALNEAIKKDQENH